MARYGSSICLAILLAGVQVADGAYARSRSSQDPRLSTSIVDGPPTLAPFQHVRFCLRYPSDCKSNPAENERIELNSEISDLLKQVNHSVNMSITPTLKSYGPELQDGWTIAPVTGDCNDYAVTKRHQLLESGLPAKALRLSVVKTSSGVGHLVLIVVTTKSDIVMDNLTEVIRPWQNTDYQWLKIQSANEARLWYQVKAPDTSVSDADGKVRLADR
jgi:predicted transglutaminase-like cysteine proteinase